VRNSVLGYRICISYASVDVYPLLSINAVIELFPFLTVDECEVGMPVMDTIRYIKKSEWCAKTVSFLIGISATVIVPDRALPIMCFAPACHSSMPGVQDRVRRARQFRR
jgi:hypothetical protein